MRSSTFVTILIVAGLTFLGLWQFSAKFREMLGLKGRPFDFAFGTGTTNNAAFGGTPPFDSSMGQQNPFETISILQNQIARMPKVVPNIPTTRPRKVG